MKAFEARMASVMPQYETAKKEISQAINWGWKSAHICHHGTLYNEVAEMLAEEGYDIKIVRRSNEMMSYNVASWEFAEENRKGTIIYVDETEKKSQEPEESKGTDEEEYIEDAE